MVDLLARFKKTSRTNGVLLLWERSKNKLFAFLGGKTLLF